MTARPGVLLLHGLGATGAVWGPVAALLGARDGRRCLAPDLPGHGSGRRLPAYRVDAVAAELAPLVAGRAALLVVGHSFGGYVALALAGGPFGGNVAGVLTVGTRLTFSDEERARALELARRPARVFATEQEALERYRRVSGLEAGLAPDAALLAGGVVREAAGFRLAADPATLGVEVPPFASLLAAARCPVVVARGERDAQVSSAELRAVAPSAIDVAGRGHNLHVEDPAALVALLERLSGTFRDRAAAP